jgi:hypothetical protein
MTAVSIVRSMIVGTPRWMLLLLLLTHPLSYPVTMAQQELPSVQVPNVPSTTIVTSSSPTESFGVVVIAPPTSPTGPAPPTSPTGPTAPTNTLPTVQPTTILATIQPTTTYPPTITAFPTRSVAPSSSTSAPTPYAICNVCITGTISINDNIPLANGNVTCVEVADVGLSGLLNSTNCEAVQQLLFNEGWCSCIRDSNGTTIPPALAPSVAVMYEPCNICGDGAIVSILDGQLPVSNSTTDGPLDCGFVQTAGNSGLFEPDVCDYFMNVSGPCGCIDDPTTPSPAGTAAPTSEYIQCFVCGNETEQVTAMDVVVNLTETAMDLLAQDVNTSLLTCEFVETSGRFNNSWDRLVCSYLQMVVRDVCECQPIPPSPSPSTSPSVSPMVAAVVPSVPTPPTASSQSTGTSSACIISVSLLPVLWNVIWMIASSSSRLW